MARCGTIGCKKEATHELVYSFQESRDQQERDEVCERCGYDYTHRPSLKATVTPLASPSAGSIKEG